MFLEDKELRALRELGFDVHNGRIVKTEEKLAFEDLSYIGFNAYISKDNRVFEKVGDELIEVDTPEIKAERNFIKSQMNKNSL